MDLTVGILEEKLRKFPKGTSITVSCGCCNHGALGSENIIEIADKTNQTYGYIEINLNNSSKAEVELSKDKEEFYKAEVDKLSKIIKEHNLKLKIYKEHIESNMKSSEWVLKKNLRKEGEK